MLGRACRFLVLSEELKRALLAGGDVNVSVGAGGRGLARGRSDDLVSGWISRDEFSRAAPPLAAVLVMRAFGARFDVPSPFPLLPEAGVAVCGCRVSSSSSRVGKLRLGGSSRVGQEHDLDPGCDPETPRRAGPWSDELDLNKKPIMHPKHPKYLGYPDPIGWTLVESLQGTHKARAATQGGCYSLLPRFL